MVTLGWERVTVALGVDTRLGIATRLSECQSILCDTLLSFSFVSYFDHVHPRVLFKACDVRSWPAILLLNTDAVTISPPRLREGGQSLRALSRIS